MHHKCASYWLNFTIPLKIQSQDTSKRVYFKDTIKAHNSHPLPQMRKGMEEFLWLPLKQLERGSPQTWNGKIELGHIVLWCNCFYPASVSPFVSLASPLVITMCTVHVKDHPLLKMRTLRVKSFWSLSYYQLMAGSQVLPFPTQAPCHAAYENSDDTFAILNPRGLHLPRLRFLRFQPM